MKQEVGFVQREVLKEKPDFASLGFGKYFSDYMFVMDYQHEIGWYDPRITPY
jgi:branched-chain amino acid aminotransferase